MKTHHPSSTSENQETTSSSKETSSIKTFAELGLPESLLEAVTALGFQTPTPIQNQTIPLLLSGKDMIGQAQTGTGKTAAFGLPLLQKLNPDLEQVQALILAPTRELALQVAEAIHSYAAYLPGIQVLPMYGGTSFKQQLDQLDRGVQVVVGTPGRVMDHIRRGSLDLSKLTYLVLDEADEMLRMGFIEDVTWILSHTPKERQTALFSATLPKEIQHLAEQFLKNPVRVKIQQKTLTSVETDERYVQVKESKKLEVLNRILEAEPIESVLIFTRTKIRASDLVKDIEELGYRVEALHSDISQGQRQVVLRRFRQKQLEVLVATDVAARGLDIKHVSHVINYDVPENEESYVHRIGRTGRAGRTGVSILFATPSEKNIVRRIENYTKQPLRLVPIPSQVDVLTGRKERLLKRLEKAMEQDITGYMNLVTEWLEVKGWDVKQLAAAALRLASFDKAWNETANSTSKRSENTENVVLQRTEERFSPKSKKAKFVEPTPSEPIAEADPSFESWGWDAKRPEFSEKRRFAKKREGSGKEETQGSSLGFQRKKPFHSEKKRWGEKKVEGRPEGERKSRFSGFGKKGPERSFGKERKAGERSFSDRFSKGKGRPSRSFDR